MSASAELLSAADPQFTGKSQDPILRINNYYKWLLYVTTEFSAVLGMAIVQRCIHNVMGAMSLGSHALRMEPQQAFLVKEARTIRKEIYCLTVLQEFDRTKDEAAGRTWPWDRDLVCEFPFITACLIQGIGFDADGKTHSVRPKPLATIYRDTSLEWGMVVIDISSLVDVRYGIVEYTTQRGHEKRTRKVMSAAEYMDKFNYEKPERDNIAKLLASISVVRETALELVWPSEMADDVLPTLAAVTMEGAQGSPHGDESRHLLKHLETNEPGSSGVIQSPEPKVNHKMRLQRKLIDHSTKLGSTKSAEQLLRIGFADHGHLGLELLANLGASTISAAMDQPNMERITSISLCIDKISDAAEQVISAIARIDSIRELYLLQRPAQRDDTLSEQVFQYLAEHPKFLQCSYYVVPDGITQCPSFAATSTWATLFSNPSASPLGLLRYMQTLITDGPFSADANPPERLFCFSTSPSSFADDHLHSAEAVRGVSIPPQSTVSPVRAVRPIRRRITIASGEDNDGGGVATGRSQSAGAAAGVLISPGDIQAVGLREFLRITAPQVSGAVVDQRLQQLGDAILSSPGQGPLPSGIKPLAVFSQNEAAEVLGEFLRDSADVHKRLREALKESPGGN
ncbi:hypothetical protein BX600DRAFT_537281 [Xylariales sp. PMI_506]|nr:hypothetical protein BX600DRAFT_537281 [Xylariales sp. PMI_506]